MAPHLYPVPRSSSSSSSSCRRSSGRSGSSGRAVTTGERCYPTLHLKFQSGHGDLDDNRNRWFPAWEECCHRSMDFTYLQTPHFTKTQHLDKISHILESLCWRVRHWLRHNSSGNKTPKVSPSSHHRGKKRIAGKGALPHRWSIQSSVQFPLAACGVGDLQVYGYHPSCGSRWNQGGETKGILLWSKNCLQKL